jgi:beta-galactosidase
MPDAGPTPPTVRVCRSGLDLCNGERLPLWSGALHYWRVRRDRWAAALAGVRDLGFAAVETYVPWGVHEIAPGRFDFGERDPQRDLGAFLTAAQEAGLKAVVRPGPHVNAELTFFGYPERLLRDPAVLARTARNTPAFLPMPPRAFPVPSYASRAFRAEAATWLRAVAEVLRPRLHPAGPVVAIQVDNECAFFFRGGPFDLDYHPDAVADFRRFLEARYGDVAALRAAWGQADLELATVAPPRAFGATVAAELPPYLDWITAKERGVVDALAALAAVLREEGLGTVPLFHNLPPQDPAAAGLAGIERALDFCGVDLHHPARDYERVRERVLYLAGTSRFPYVPELGAGAMLVGLPVRPEEQRSLILAALMHGLKGANLYMAVDRDRWYGAPLGSDGRPRAPLGPFLARLGAALKETRLFELERPAAVAVVLPPVYHRLRTATQLLDAGPPMVLELAGLGAAETCREDDLGLGGPVAIEAEAATRTVTGALGRAHLPYLIVDGAVDPARLARFAVLVCPTFDLLDGAVQQALLAAAAAGVRVLWGPRRPAFDEALRPLVDSWPGAPFLTPARLGDEAVLAADLAALAAELGLAVPFPAREPEVDTALYAGDAADPRVLFVGTRAPRALTAHVRLDAPAVLRDLIGAEVLGGADATEVEVALEPYGVRMFAVTDPAEVPGA